MRTLKDFLKNVTGIKEEIQMVVKSILELNMNIENISKVTKLTIEEIEELKIIYTYNS